MAILANVVNQVADIMQSQFQLNRMTPSLEQVSTRLLSLITGAVFLLFSFVLFLLLSLLTNPALPAQAQGAVLSAQQVVEYALTLEKLEDDLYKRASVALRSGGLASAPQVVKDAIASYGEDEAQHVVDLSAVLTAIGGNPAAITLPANPNYNAILGRDPFANVSDFLLALQFVEDLGVAAYKGQVQNLQAAGNDTLLGGALEIHTIEARHAAGIRYLRQVLFNANVRPWIRNASEVNYNENRSGFPIPFRDEAFDGFATSDEVLALVGPILGAAPAATSQPTAPASALEGSVTQADCPPGTKLQLLSGGYICKR